ncbi:LOW QUALITY PROTEIN: hypothetical protein OSB04_016175 [Centaurea solstitialis]|uniref:Retrotransposon gag domain-containing protein n=1 Tax=Centaurea solstitialis TaxID=347529 RepID=A0AA38TCB7_9ASTR|nr:LOW QUALITY PROTEIN: hypothetical protein OSB04_016175 [Centaurea solstitialis]
MPRSSRTGSPLSIDLEIERTAKRLRKQAKLRKKLGEGTSSPGVDIWRDINLSSDSDEENKEKQKKEEEGEKLSEMGDGNERTLRELATPDVAQVRICIRYPQGNDNFILKTGLVHLLPSYHGLENEDPNKHLKEFHVVCLSMKPHEVTEDLIKLKAFPFSLKDRAKDWLYSLPPGSVTTWNQMARLFLDKFFPASKAATLGREICSIKQRDVETLHEYWERFNIFVCPQLGISEQLLLQYFYEGLLPMERKMIDAASGGAIFNKTPTQVRALITTMAENSQHFSVQGDMRREPQKVNEVNVGSIESRLYDLTNLVKQLVVGKEQVKHVEFAPGWTILQTRVRNCKRMFWFHPRTLTPLEVFRANNLNKDFITPTLAPKDLHNTSFDPNQAASSSSGTSLEDIVKSLAINTQQFQQETRTNIQNLVAQNQSLMAQQKHLETQVGQLALSVGRIEAQGKLPSQTEAPQKLNVSMVMVKDEKMVGRSRFRSEFEDKMSKFVIPPPFPERFKQLQEEKKMEAIPEEVKDISQVDQEIVQELVQEAKSEEEELAVVDEEDDVLTEEDTSPVKQTRLPPKCEDPGEFSIPCRIGNVLIERALLDLGSDVNIMPLSIFNFLDVGSLKETTSIIQLANGHDVLPKGMIEDVLVYIDKLAFSIDFFVLDMIAGSPDIYDVIVLGRPFMKASKTIIDMDKDIITMEVDVNKVVFVAESTNEHPSGVSFEHFAGSPC